MPEKKENIFTLRLPIKMHARLRELAYTRHSSINKIILEALVASGIEK